MGETTSIAWTDATFNPWWGCTKYGAGCLNCYAETFDKRTGGAHWGPSASRRRFGDKHWNEPEKWDREAARLGVRSRVFCGSMCDVFEERGDLTYDRERLWGLIRRTPRLDWLLLTKRPHNIAPSLPALWAEGWPNVWLGTSVACADDLIGLDPLKRVPAAVRFVSMEPLVEPTLFATGDLDGIAWVIVGGESGARARPMDAEWARAIKRQCDAAGVAFFMKQLGGPASNKRDRPEDFPEDLRVREFPEAGR